MNVENKIIRIPAVRHTTEGVKLIVCTLFLERNSPDESWRCNISNEAAEDLDTIMTELQSYIESSI